RAFLSSGAGGGVIQDTASSATLCALIAARERATGFRSRGAGVAGRLTVYASEHAHALVDKAMIVSGLGEENLRRVEADDRCAMRPEALAAAIAADRAAGRTPCLVVATVGTTSSHGLDPLGPIGAICRREGAWLHVDAAHAGTAALCPEHRSIHAGLELADSYCFNPHKWMLTNFDCDCLWVADRATLVRALSVLPEYLRNRATESGRVWDYRDWQVPLGRRFRALKLWFVIRHYGVEGLRRHVREHVRLAQAFAARVAAEPRLELVVPAPLTLVCFRHADGDEASERMLERLNDTGRVYLTHTRLFDRFTLRMAIGGTHTGARHVDDAWALVRETAAEVAG
ncbi:MAG: pyridoxal-dependent decarboxylase, partial [Planctomycetota bacterium]